MLITIILISCLLIFTALYLFFNKKGFNNRVLSAFEQLSATMNLENASVQRMPSLSLTGTYRTFDIVIECSPKKVNGKRREGWRFTTTLPRPAVCRFYIQGEGSEGRLTKVIDLDVVTTDDALFDNQVLLFSSCKETAKRVWTPYLRQRFISTDMNDFSMEVLGDEAAFELNIEPLASVRQIRRALEAWVEFLNIVAVI